MSTAFDASRLEALRGTMTAENFARLVRLFAADLALRLGLLDEAIKGEDQAGTRAAAHAIRGLAANMGAVALSAQAAAIETEADTATTAEQAALFETLLGEAMAAQLALDHMLA